MALREDQIANSVGFLTHPSVVSRSPQEKSDFLLQKGLSLDEIKEAFKRADAQLGRTSSPTSGAAAGSPAAAAPVAPTVIYQQMPAPEPPWWSSVLAPAALLLSASTGLAYVYKTLVEPQLDPMQPPPLALPNDPLAPPLSQQPPPTQAQQPGGSALSPWQQQQPPPPPQQQQQQQLATYNSSVANSDVQALRKAVEEQSSSIKDLVGSLKDVVTQLQDRAKQPDMMQVMMAMQGSGDIKAELASIKTLLLATHLQGRGGQLQHLTENGVGDMSALPLNLSAVEALTKATSPPPPSATASAQANPEEEKEREDAKRESEAIARGREALAKMNAQCQGDEDMVHACNMLIMFIRNVLKEPHIPRYRRIARSNAGFKKSLEPLEGHLQVLEAVGFEEKGATSLEMSPQYVESLESADGRQWARNVLEDMVTNLDSVIAQRKAPPPAPPRTAPPPAASSSSPVAAAAADQPAYPTPFADVVRMQQQGITPPGIKTIPDKLSEDAPSKSSMQAPPKPWEQRGMRGAHVEMLPDEPTSD